MCVREREREWLRAIGLVLFAKYPTRANILNQQKEKTINIICESPINPIVFVTTTKTDP